MPEGPELHLASLFVNRMCKGVVFSGSVEKSEVSKSPEVPFTCSAYRISATSRGKEVRVTLTPIKSEDNASKHQKTCRGKKVADSIENQEPMDVVFRFGMSGFFRFTPENEVPKHAHLRFYTREEPPHRQVLSYVDVRRFGSWQPNGTWQPDRGPCIMFEYDSFRENVLANLADKAFDRPICEVLLNQKYFNGIGNYLRAEILFRLSIPPFVKARTVLEGLQVESKDDIKKEVKKEDESKPQIKGGKKGAPDLLTLCHTVPLEVVKMGGKGYDPEKNDYSDFEAWLQCYYVDGMKSIRDHNGRTMWFKGDPGPMAPKDCKSPKAKKRVKKQEDHDYTDGKKGAKKRRTKKETEDCPTNKPAGERKTSRRQNATKKAASTFDLEEGEKEEDGPAKENAKPKGSRKSKTSTSSQKKVTQRASRSRSSRGSQGGQEKKATTPRVTKTQSKRKSSSMNGKTNTSEGVKRRSAKKSK